jgi:(p)ppGpp synthase/HD superfamily hydrolase
VRWCVVFNYEHSERAIALAALAHEGQLDKAGVPYILHPLRVMLRLTGTEERIVGVLHDVVEDCGWTLQRLQEEGFSGVVIMAVDAVSQRPGESYEDFISRAAGNHIGRLVKLADLEDNCDMGRLGSVTDQDLRRLEKYQRAISILRKSP